VYFSYEMYENGNSVRIIELKKHVDSIKLNDYQYDAIK